MNKLAELPFLIRGPIYKEVKRRIMDSLAAGEWKPGQAIPAEHRLAERFGISIGTLRKAIDELVAENVLLRQQGRGTFVASHGGDGMRFLFFNIVRHDGVREYPDVRLERFARGRADDDEARRLQIAPRSAVIRFRNALSLAGAPVGVDDITVPAALFDGLTQRRLQQRGNTVYHLYEHGFGISVVRTAETVRAVAAEAEIAALLRLPPLAPVLQVRRVAYTLHDRPVEARVSWIDTARYEYQREP